MKLPNKEGYEAAELRRRLQCAEDLKTNLSAHLKKHPRATEEDIVKFVFQGMLGVGHLVSSHKKTLDYIIREMNSIQADDREPLIEELSTFWVRMNLRAAKAREINPAEIEILVYNSAKYHPVSFTRQDVYNLCMELDEVDREKMKAAAEKVLDESWLPSHSDQYRNAYHPAYRVVYKDYRKQYKLKDLEENSDEDDRV